MKLLYIHLKILNRIFFHHIQHIVYQQPAKNIRAIGIARQYRFKMIQVILCNAENSKYK